MARHLRSVHSDIPTESEIMQNAVKISKESRLYVRNFNSISDLKLKRLLVAPYKYKAGWIHRSTTGE